MTTNEYQIAPGWNNSGSLSSVNPQPKSFGLKSARRTQAADRIIYEDGFKSTEWKFGYLTLAQWKTFQDSIGLGNGTPSAKATVRTTRNYQHEFANFNAIIVMPNFPDEAQYDRGVILEVTVTLQSLEEIS